MYNKLLKLFIVIYGLTAIILFASEPDSLILTNDAWVEVDSILIRGNDITEDFVILRELTFKPGDAVNGKTLAFNRERIYSLGLFNFVEVYAIQNGSEIHIVIEVEESWYIYPIPFINIRNKNLERTSYGINLLYRNFRGRNETIQAVASFGYDQFYLLSYYNPLFIESENITLLTSLLYQTPLNKSLKAAVIRGDDFDYTVTFGSVTIGKRINQFNELLGTAGYSYIEAPSGKVEGIMASNTNIDRTLVLGGAYVYDTRDLKQFPNNGIFSKIEIMHKGLIDNKIDYNLLALDFREYRPVFDEITSKWRFAYTHTFGKFIPLYDQAFFGFADFIRGHYNDRREGHNSIRTSIEAAVPIIKEWNFSIDLPLLPKKLTSARIGLHFNLFFDAGVTYNNNENISIKQFDSGWGAGFTLLFLPYNAVRFEYALDEFGNGEFLFGTGFSF
jgi:outer membrane protein assembly factor BamA